MATQNKVFVSPGVYTSELDLTFVAQSVGVTTLGLSGETIKGPAFEPVLITNFDEFKTYFGTTSPEKDGAGNPKYELPYVAKSYLQESNQLFVTRVLGLTGYKPYKTFGIKTIGGFLLGDIVNSETTIMDPTPFNTFTGSTYYAELNTKTSIDGDSVAHYILKSFSGTTGNNGIWFVIGQVPAADIDDAGLDYNDEQQSPMTGEITANSNYTANWWNTYNNGVDEVYSYLFVWNGSLNRFDVTKYIYSATLVNDGVLVAALRSRGTYDNHEVLNLQIKENTGFTVNSTTVSTNPLGEFTITTINMDGVEKEATCSLDSTSSKYITKVLGVAPFDKDETDIPLYVHEVYPNTLALMKSRGLVRGLNMDELVYHSVGTDFLTDWDTPSSPMVVSEVRGGMVSDLFQVFTVSDGDAANYQVKITIANVDLDSGEFDLVVRDFNDTDDNMALLEKFTRCSMNPEANGYIARKVGTTDGEYPLNSKYIILSMNEGHPTDTIPAGFRGFAADTVGGATLGVVSFKTSYYEAGDFTGSYDAQGNEVLAARADKAKKTTLGLSSDVTYDIDLFKYKGVNSDKATQGFHMSVNAGAITGNTLTGFEFETTSYDLEGTDKGKLATLANRKFTFAVCGGFDGWDIYRRTRTNTDRYIFGKKTYISGNTLNGGVFSTTIPNSDHYAYLKGVETYSNPEAVDINVFATPGINFLDHGSLVTQTIDIIENDRADSLYIINSPNVSTADEVVGNIDDSGIDSNYSATYWPWIQVRDTDNATQLYIPPTGEVLRNIALTDNVSYPWFAVAGYSRGLVKSIKATKKLTLDERDTLYKNRINPIATFSDTGTIIWGNKTLQVRESALDRINVRRLLLRARKLISAVAVRLLFEQNDDQVRQEFLRLVNPILDAIKKERGLYDFRVTVSNAPEDIDANTLRGKIYIKPTRALEYIDLEFVITPTGASFENI